MKHKPRRTDWVAGLKASKEPTFFSCRILTPLTVSICSVKHQNLNRALAHARKIQRGLGLRAIMVEVVARVLFVEQAKNVK